MWPNILKISLVLIVVSGLAILGKQNNQRRLMANIEIVIDPERAALISRDSVNKLLTLALEDSLIASKSNVNLKVLERLFEQNNLIENAETYLMIDGTLGVNVLPKQPIARVMDEPTFYLDAKGNAFPLSPDYSARVPVITGKVSKEQQQELTHLINQINKDNFMAHHITGISYSKQGIVLESRDHNYDIVLGDTLQITKKIMNYKAFYLQAKEANRLSNYTHIRLAFENQVVCTTK